jgi:hypothetical protein
MQPNNFGCYKKQRMVKTKNGIHTKKIFEKRTKKKCLLCVLCGKEKVEYPNVYCPNCLEEIQ